LGTVYLLAFIILGTLVLVAALDYRFHRKNPVDIFHIQDPIVEKDTWLVEQVHDIKKFFEFVFSQATEDDRLIIMTFTGCVQPHLWMKFCIFRK